MRGLANKKRTLLTTYFDKKNTMPLVSIADRLAVAAQEIEKQAAQPDENSESQTEVQDSDAEAEAEAAAAMNDLGRENSGMEG